MTTTRLSIRSSRRLASGYEIPLLGFGVYKTPPEETEALVASAIKAGYRHVDSAILYHNEEACANALIKSGIPREQLFFTTKVPHTHSGYENAKEHIDESVRKIGKLGYIDLMLIHGPHGGRERRLGAWRALVEAVEAGKIRSIGVSNYGVHHLDELETYIKETDAKLGSGKGGVLSVNQVEAHPWLPREDIVEWCNKRNVAVQAWGPIVRGKRSDHPTLLSVVKRTGKSPAQVLIRWSLQAGYIPLPKTATPSRIPENADVYDFELSKDDMAALETSERFNSGWDPTTLSL